MKKAKKIMTNEQRIERAKNKFIGEKFSHLKIIDVLSLDENNISYNVLCKCDCGNEIKTNLRLLQRGDKVNCGRNCLYKKEYNNKGKSKYKNIFDFSNEDYIIGYDKNNKMFYFDKEDFDKIKNFYWAINKNGYVCTSSRTQNPHNFFLHRYLMNPPSDMVIDHINHCRHDNRKSNLKICTQKENMKNLSPNSKNFQYPITCHYTIDGYEYLGYFDDKKSAIKAYKKIIKKETEEI